MHCPFVIPFFSDTCHCTIKSWETVRILPGTKAFNRSDSSPDRKGLQPTRLRHPGFHHTRPPNYNTSLTKEILPFITEIFHIIVSRPSPRSKSFSLSVIPVMLMRHLFYNPPMCFVGRYEYN